jgi:hypothetical protein
MKSAIGSKFPFGVDTPVVTGDMVGGESHPGAYGPIDEDVFGV